MKIFFFSLAAIVAALPVYGAVIRPTDNLPQDEYRTPQDVHAEYNLGGGNMVEITDVRHYGFVPTYPTDPGPAPGTLVTENFNSTLEFNISINNGPEIPQFVTNVPVSVNIQLISDNFPTLPGQPGYTRFFDTEMIAMNIVGGTLPPGFMVRESPTLASLGQTTITTINTGGPYQIDSFFDVFTELSIDNGATWIPQTPPASHVELVDPSPIPEPATFAAGLGLIGLTLARRPRRG
jgi:hypothetical protein